MIKKDSISPPVLNVESVFKWFILGYFQLGILFLLKPLGAEEMGFMVSKSIISLNSFTAYMQVVEVLKPAVCPPSLATQIICPAPF